MSGESINVLLEVAQRLGHSVGESLHHLIALPLLPLSLVEGLAALEHRCRVAHSAVSRGVLAAEVQPQLARSAGRLLEVMSRAAALPRSACLAVE